MPKINSVELQPIIEPDMGKPVLAIIKSKEHWAIAEVDLIMIDPELKVWVFVNDGCRLDKAWHVIYWEYKD